MPLTYADFEGGRFNNKGHYNYSAKDHTMTTMTPYAAAKHANATLAAEGIAKELPPQMFYTYVNKGYIGSVEVEGKKRITSESLATWLKGYINKQKGVTVTDTNEEVDEDQLELFEV